MPDYPGLRQPSEINDLGRFTAYMEAFLSGHGEELRNQIAQKPNDALELLHALSIGLSALFYYTGLVLKHCVEKTRRDDIRIAPDVYVGGSGSKLLEWLPICFSNDAKDWMLHRRMMLMHATYQLNGRRTQGRRPAGRHAGISA